MLSPVLVLALACVEPGAVEAPASAAFGRVALLDAEADDLVISEIFSNPAATSDADGEWFEITNVGAESIGLFGLMVVDLGDDWIEVADPDAEIAPGQHLVFGTNGDPATNGGVAVDFVYAITDLQLANTEDELILWDSWRYLDSVYYDPSFPGPVGVSASLRPEFTNRVDNQDPTRWCAASTPFGEGDLGTPGAPNDCAPDADGDGAFTPHDCDDGDPTVRPYVWDPLGDGIDQDCDGVDGGVPLQLMDLVEGDLAITELLINPARVADSLGEWFEVRNDAARPVDLRGLAVSDLGIDGFQVPSSWVVDPGERVVFGRSFDPAANGGVQVDLSYANEMALANYEDEVYLWAGPVLLDTLAWGPGHPVGNGAAMQLDPAAPDTVHDYDPARWCAATTPFGLGDLGTAGAANDGC